MVANWSEWVRIAGESAAIGSAIFFFMSWRRRSIRNLALELGSLRKSKSTIRSVRVHDLHESGGPSLVAQILLLFISKRNREHIIGDLEEEYRTSEKRYPRFWYWGQVLALVGSYWWAALRRLAGLNAIRNVIHK
jgi:hypothetical protein